MSDEPDGREAGSPRWMSDRIRALLRLGEQLDRSIEDAAELRRASEQALRVVRDLDRLHSVQTHRYPGVVVRRPDETRRGDPLVLAADPESAHYAEGLLQEGYRVAEVGDGVQVL